MLQDKISLSVDLKRNQGRSFFNFFSHNLSVYSKSIKKCIPDLDNHSDYRFLKKSDKMRIQINLENAYDQHRHKLQESLLQKNEVARKRMSQYKKEYPQKLQKSPKTHNSSTTVTEVSEYPNKTVYRKRKMSEKKRSDKKLVLQTNFIYENINSEPSYIDSARKRVNRFSSKRSFRVRENPPNMEEVIQKMRYREDSNRKKMEETFSDYFFREQNPEDQKQYSKHRIQDRLKMINEILHTFKREDCYPIKKIDNSCLMKQNGYIGLQIKRKLDYQPKSRSNSRNAKHQVQV